MIHKIFPIADGVNLDLTKKYLAMPDMINEPKLGQATIKAINNAELIHPSLIGWCAEIRIRAYGLSDIAQLRQATLEMYHRWPELFDVADPTNMRSGIAASFIANDHLGYVLSHISNEEFYNDYLTARIFYPGLFNLFDPNMSFGYILLATPITFPDGKMDLRVLLGNYRIGLTKAQLIQKIQRMFIPISQALRFGNTNRGTLVECSARATKNVKHHVYGMVPEKTAFINLQQWDGKPMTLTNVEWTSN